MPDATRVSRYFAYGANLLHEHMRSVCPDARPLSRARVAGWARVFWRVLTIEPDALSAVDGAVWETSAADERHLDAIEAYPEWYDKRVVEVVLQDGSSASAYAYMMRLSRMPVCPPDGAYLETCLRGAREWGIPGEAILGPARLARERGEPLPAAAWPWDESMWKKYVRDV